MRVTRKGIALLLVIVSLTATTIITANSAFSAEATENSWTARTSMREARAYLGVAVVNGKIYAIGGDTGRETGSVTTGTGCTLDVASTNEEYDPSSDAWTLKASMPTPRAGLGVAVHENKIYCIGGWTNTNGDYSKTAVNEVYNPDADIWETKSPFPSPSNFLVANTVNGKIYVLPLYSTSSNDVYDPTTDSWTEKTPPLNQITSFSSMVVDDEIYFLAAQTNSSGLWTEACIQVYNTSNDSWRVLGKSPWYGVHAGGGGTIGLNAPRRLYFFEETGTYAYDPLNGNWTVAASMPSPRLLVGVVVVGDRFYVMGGRSGEHGAITLMKPSSVNEEYTPIGYGTVSSDAMIETDSIPEILLVTAVVSVAVIVTVLMFVYFKRKRVARND